jgi:hypothetical protein
LPFIRYARDKRGYESTFVMHAYRAGQGGARTRVLYFFRSPSNLKIGRRPLDAEVQEALEHTHPDLSFDWDMLLREPPPARFEPRERARRPTRSEAARPQPPAEAQAAVVIEDESVLGRTLGAREAARLRGRYNDLLQRVARRARTPEERDRLTDRLMRLNPDDWADEAAVRAGVAGVESEWEAIASELPQRRRGRRGGRSRGGEPRPSPAFEVSDAVEAGDLPEGLEETEGEAAPAEASGIINEEGDPDEPVLEEVEAGLMGQDDDVPGAGDRGGLGPESGTGERDAVDGADGPGVPGRDRDHLD